ncbi:hypothetical protein AVHY2522_09770 [Acidovorax sp. SUPP2522]|uniref:hypothetical protein n=1 Tax=unclassified Acidovorax TaxID=2684926 RepID=UPI00234A83CC|nr:MULTISPECIES: hypothetical protein [unclassified Acidovorax]WCM99188.1 hypothetical protein M5C96_07105 [Acidovorax sp. GBBC 1281]GKT15900.1 hypothetical protein AVHY2522_09770 [Acidovorax sp. SUPP2522]
MLLVKTSSGHLALKDRHGALTSRQRSAFILFDGKRTLAQVLAATATMGIGMDDVLAMVGQGLLSLPDGSAPDLQNASPEGVPAPADASGAAPATGEASSPMERYQAAYPIATEITSSLGLRGFRLNLAVEGARSFDDLAALAPKIRELVGDEKYRRLERALFG